MRFREIIARVSGLSSPIFGVSWSPPEAEIAVARRVVSYLEDRRVLYNPSEMEVPEHCVESVLGIRRLLTAELGPLAPDAELAASLRAMRAACRKFLDTVGAGGRSEIVRFGAHRGHWASWEFNGALGELRGVIGVHVARIAAQHGLDVEDALAAILPAHEGAEA